MSIALLARALRRRAGGSINADFNSASNHRLIINNWLDRLMIVHKGGVAFRERSRVVFGLIVFVRGDRANPFEDELFQ